MIVVDLSDAPDCWSIVELRRSKRIREVHCCGGSVDVGSEYRHIVMRLPGERGLTVHDEHHQRSECYAHYRA